MWQAVPLGLYAGWLTAASGVAVSAVLTGHGILPAQVAAVLMLSIVVAVALFVLTRADSDWSYTPALLWALAGVIAANIAPINLPVVTICGLGILLLAYVAVLHRKA